MNWETLVSFGEAKVETYTIVILNNVIYKMMPKKYNNIL